MRIRTVCALAPADAAAGDGVPSTLLIWVDRPELVP